MYNFIDVLNVIKFSIVRLTQHLIKDGIDQSQLNQKIHFHKQKTISQNQTYLIIKKLHRIIFHLHHLFYSNIFYKNIPIAFHLVCHKIQLIRISTNYTLRIIIIFHQQLITGFHNQLQLLINFNFQTHLISNFFKRTINGLFFNFTLFINKNL